MEKRGNLTVFNTVVSARQAHLGILGIANLLGSAHTTICRVYR